MRALLRKTGLGPLLLVLLACGSSGQPQPAHPSTVLAAPTPTPTTTTSISPVPRSTTPALPRLSGRPMPGSVPPTWLGKRVLPRKADGFGEIRPTPVDLEQRRFTLPDRLPALPGRGFASRIASPAPPRVLARSTWVPGCPVAAEDLAWVRLSFWGFDERRHTGELLVNRAAAEEVVAVFARLYAARFPIEEMRITTRAEQDLPPTGDGNDTGSFDCRSTRGGSSYSQHAYGLAVDLNPFQNPYQKGELVLPELASSYLDRSWVRPGMITPGGPVVRAFAEIGWTWGGTWTSLKDLHHFSANGR